jgi:hypothetical protein
MINGSAAWIPNIGRHIIKDITMTVGGFDRIGNITFYHNEQKMLNGLSNEHRDKMLGNVKELTLLTKTTDPYTLYIPLKFWSDEYSVDALPIRFSNCDQIAITTELRKLSELIVTTDGAQVPDLEITAGFIVSYMHCRP